MVFILKVPTCFSDNPPREDVYENYIVGNIFYLLDSTDTTLL